MDSNIIVTISLGLLVLYIAVRLVSRRKTNEVVLKSKISDGALVLDVRNPAEFEDGHYSGALNIPVDQLASRLQELGNTKDRSIIVYCASGARAGNASRILKQAGFTDVINAGGLFNMPRD